MKYIKYIILGVILYSCEPKEIEKEKEHEWKDISIQSINIDWQCIQMLDENIGFIGGLPQIQFVEETSISQEVVTSGEFSYNIDFTYQNTDIVPEPCLYTTSDGGTSWDIIETPFRNGVHQICFINNNIGYVSCEEGVYKTMNSGFSWKKLLYSTVYGKNQIISGLYRLYFLDTQTGYAYFEGNTTFTLKTTDGGTTWILIDNINGKHIYQTNQIAYTTTKYDLYKTTDNGNTWSQLNVNADNIYDVYFYTSDNFIVSTDNKVMETTDGGITWTPYNVPIKYETKKMVLFNKEAYMIDAENIYHFDDFSQIDINEAANEYIMTREKEERINGISFPNSKTGFAVGDNGMILRYKKE